MPDPFDFGPVPLGEHAGPQGFNVANTGDIPLTVKVIGGVRAPFSVARWRYPTTLASGESFIVGVRFAPTQPGTFADVLVVAFNELDSTLEVPLRGEGVAQRGEGIAQRGEGVAPPITEPPPTAIAAPRQQRSLLPWVIGGVLGAVYLYNKRR